MKTDLSAKAVTARLKRVSQLRRLCLSLARAKPIPPKGSKKGVVRGELWGGSGKKKPT